MEIRQFKDIGSSFESKVGGKALNLAKLQRFGFNVPNGFVLVDFDATQSKKIFDMFERLKLKTVAVRSSAICEDGSATSFAGQFETILFVKKSNLIAAIETCFSSNKNENAVFYAKQNNILEEDTKVSVVVQTMIKSEISGVIFTTNPVSEDDEILIECILGVGEKLVQGEITPSQIRLDKATGKVISYLGEKLIDEKQITELYQMGMGIEKAFGSAQDIEFAFANNELFVLQARPITTK